MSRFGLSDAHLEMIIATCQSVPSLRRARIFGSRALGRFHKGSDIDIAVEGLSDRETRSFHGLLDDLPMPYLFSVINCDTIDHANLRAHVDRVGLSVFERRFQP